MNQFTRTLYVAEKLATDMYYWHTVEDRHASLRSAVSDRSVRDHVLRANKYLNLEIFRVGVRTGDTLLTVDPNGINIIFYLSASRCFLSEFCYAV